MLPFNLVTYNIYFSSVAIPARMRAIGQFISRYRPAVLALQEMTWEHWRVLQTQSWYQHYESTHEHCKVVPTSSSTYFVVLLSALPILSVGQKVFANSRMGRELLYIKVSLQSYCNNDAASPKVSNSTTKAINCIVATSHFESLPQNALERREQIQETWRILSQEVNDDPDRCLAAIFMGDTNLLNGELIGYHQEANQRRPALQQYVLQIAPSSRAQCRACPAKISKGAVRLGKLTQERIGVNLVTRTSWYHIHCFHDSNPKVSLPNVPGWQALSADQQTDLLSRYPGVDNDQTSPMAVSELPPPWIDLWLASPGNTEENGYTYDGKINGMIAHSSHQSRLDRMWMYSNPVLSTTLKMGLHVQQIQRIGMTAIDATKAKKDRIWPSDHFGLQCSLLVLLPESQRAPAAIDVNVRKDDDDASYPPRPTKKSRWQFPSSSPIIIIE